MRNETIFSLVLILSIFIIFPAFSQTETITITTYYPAPFGVYNNLRLFPSNQPATCDEGNMYYDRNTHQVMVCGQNAVGALSWQGVGLWTRNGNNIYPDDPNWNVGIGTTNPQARLDVVGGVKVGFTTTCNPITGGTLRYSNTDQLEVCDGTTSTWTSVGGEFGGIYAGYSFWWYSYCFQANPKTGHCSCPAGFHTSGFWPWTWLVFYCYK